MKIVFSVGHMILQLLIKTLFACLINELKNTWPTDILMKFMNFYDNLLQDGNIFFQNIVDNFKMHKTQCSIWDLGAFFP